MNLETLMLRRAEEQVSSRGSKLIQNPKWGAPRTCECGTCPKCRKRESMRRSRRTDARRLRLLEMALAYAETGSALAERDLLAAARFYVQPKAKPRTKATEREIALARRRLAERGIAA